MALKSFRTAPQIEIEHTEWAVIATSAGRGRDDTRCMVGLYNGELKDPRTFDIGDTEARAQIIEAYAQRAQTAPETIERALMRLIMEIEGLLQEDDTARKSQAVRLIELAEESDAIFFHDQLGDSYCATKKDGREVLKVRSRAFRLWLRQLMWQAENKTPGGQGIEDAVGHLDGKAMFQGETISLEVRVARDQDALWYDLGEEAVKITKGGWSIVTEPPILFKRFKANSPQIVPLKEGGNIHKFIEFTRVKTDHDQILLLAQLAASFIPGFPQPSQAISGDHGAAKTTLQEMFKAIVDPSIALTLSIPDTVKDFAQQASHHWVLFYDNLSKLPQWFSDCLCKAVTGQGFSKRELYSDDDDILYAFRRVVGVNAITLVVERPDLLDRSLLIHLDRVPNNERRERDEIWREFDQEKPVILGGIFDVLSKAMKIHPTLELTSLPRMADFARWGEAIAQAMRYEPGTFLKAYHGNVEAQNESAIEASPIAQAIIGLAKDRLGEVFNDTPTVLLEKLTEIAEQLKLDTKSKGSRWPKNVSWLWIMAEKDRTEDRKIVITRTIPENADDAVGADGEKEDQEVTPVSIFSDAVSADGTADGDDSIVDSTVSTKKNADGDKLLNHKAPVNNDGNDSIFRNCPSDSEIPQRPEDEPLDPDRVDEFAGDDTEGKPPSWWDNQDDNF
jgi:hypothetical protein